MKIGGMSEVALHTRYKNDPAGAGPFAIKLRDYSSVSVGLVSTVPSSEELPR